ncbi:MAG: nuclease-related domain-containing protein, partial [Nocardioides sp.]
DSVDSWRDLAGNRPGEGVRAEARARTTTVTRVLRLFGVRGEDYAWRVGAQGERKVARTLAVARVFGWRALHSVPLGRGDIDHVLVGPPGVVTINTKHHRRQRVRAGRRVVFVSGQERTYGQKANRERGRAERLLAAAGVGGVPVTSIVVIVGARSVRGRRSDGVRILTRRGLLGWLMWQTLTTRTITPDQRTATYAIARRSTTWQ